MAGQQPVVEEFGLKYLWAPLVMGIFSLLGISAQKSAIANWVLAYLFVGGIVLIGWALWLRYRRIETRQRVWFFGSLGLTALAFVPLALGLVLASPDTHGFPSVSKPASVGPPAAPVLDDKPRPAPLPRPGLLYINLASIDPAYAPGLMQAMRDAGFSMTDDPAQSDLTLQVSADVSVDPAVLVGSTATWQAISNTSLKAVDSRNRRQIFWSLCQGRGTALQPAKAREYAVINGFDQLISQYRAAARR